MISIDPTLLIIVGEVMLALVIALVALIIVFVKTRKRDQKAAKQLKGKIEGNAPKRQELFEQVLASTLDDESGDALDQRRELAANWVGKENDFYNRLVEMYLKRNSVALQGLDKLLQEYTSSYLDLVTIMRERIASGQEQVSMEAREQLEKLADEGERLNDKVKNLEGDNRRLNRELKDAYREIEQTMREYTKAFRVAGGVALAGAAEEAASESFKTDDNAQEEIAQGDFDDLGDAIEDFGTESVVEGISVEEVEIPVEEPEEIAQEPEPAPETESQDEMEEAVALAELPGEESAGEEDEGEVTLADMPDMADEEEVAEEPEAQEDVTDALDALMDETSEDEAQAEEAIADEPIADEVSSVDDLIKDVQGDTLADESDVTEQIADSAEEEISVEVALDGLLGDDGETAAPEVPSEPQMDIADEIVESSDDAIVDTPAEETHAETDDDLGAITAALDMAEEMPEPEQDVSAEIEMTPEIEPEEEFEKEASLEDILEAVQTTSPQESESAPEIEQEADLISPLDDEAPLQSEIMDEEAFFAQAQAAVEPEPEEIENVAVEAPDIPIDEDQVAAALNELDDIESSSEELKTPVIDLADEGDIVLPELGDVIAPSAASEEISSDENEDETDEADETDIDSLISEIEKKAPEEKKIDIDEDDLLAQLDSLDIDVDMPDIDGKPKED